MKVGEIIDILKDFDKEMEVVVLALSVPPTVGPNAYSEVQSLGKGFDWNDSNKIYINLKSTVYKETEFLKQMIKNNRG